MLDTLYTYNCIINNVIDGDTVIADIDLGFKTWLHNARIRFSGINTPEIRGNEREDGLVSKHFVSAFLEGKPTIIKVLDKADKYGRILAIIYVFDNDTWVNLNELLVSEGLAKVYI